jgi:glycerol-3-phosphate dehydrogenase
MTGVGWREAARSRLQDTQFDLLVVGGGATGAAIARDAATRGLQVALCERGDFASQTSSQSSKLIHGGLRYLQNGDFQLVFESLAERRRLLQTAPHLCRPREFLYPCYAGSFPSPKLLALGVGLYDTLALWRPPVRSRRLASREVYRLAPWLRSAGLLGAQQYVDCQTDDARLVLENLLDAVTAGATVVSQVEIQPEQRRSESLRVVEAVDRDRGDRFEIRTRLLVNATGPFCDGFSGGPPNLRPTLGVHLVVDGDRLPTLGRAVVVHSPRDGRLLFVLPNGRRTIIGTTETDWPGPNGPARPPRPEDEIRACRRDVDYLLEAINHAFPPAHLQPSDVIATFAGLRPLIDRGLATHAATSREHAIWSDARGWLHVAGGKLTTMRSMGEEVVDRAIEMLRDRGLGRALRPCQTRARLLPGASKEIHVGEQSSPARHAKDLGSFDLAPDVAAHLTETYGTRVDQVVALIAADTSLGRKLDPELPYLAAELVFAIRADLACEVEDVLRRRVPLALFSKAQGLDVAEETANLLAHERGWSGERRAQSLRQYRAAVSTSRMWQAD